MQLFTTVSIQGTLFNTPSTNALPNLGISPCPHTYRVFCLQQKWPIPWNPSTNLPSAMLRSVPFSSIPPHTTTNKNFSHYETHNHNTQLQHQSPYHTPKTLPSSMTPSMNRNWISPSPSHHLLVPHQKLPSLMTNALPWTSATSPMNILNTTKSPPICISLTIQCPVGSQSMK